MKQVKKKLYLLAGILSLVAGILGIFLPLLPTTPFLLLSAWLFARSSPALYKWLLAHRVLGKYIINYRRGGVSRKVKLTVIIVLWVTILISFIWFTTEAWLRLFLIVIALSVTIHISRLKTIRE